MLSQACYWTNISEEDEEENRGGWFYKTQKQWEKETYLTRREQDAARLALRKFSWWKEELKGVPAKMHFRVDLESLFDELSRLPTRISSLADSYKLDCADAPSKIGGNEQTLKPETVSENTTETTQVLPQETALDPEVQNQTPTRTRTCSKCRADILEDDLREHERGCEGKKKRGKADSPKAFRQAEAVLKLKPASEMSSESESVDEDLFLEFRKLYKATTGAKLGRLYGEVLSKWNSAYRKHGEELLSSAFDDWRTGEGNTPWMRKQNQPIWHFLKDIDGLIAEANAAPISTQENSNAGMSIGVQKPKAQF